MKKSFINLVGILVIFLGSGLAVAFFFLHQDFFGFALTPEKALEQKGIQMVPTANFTEDVNILLDKGYSVHEVNQIFESFSSSNIAKILESDYTDLSPFFSIPNFDFSKLDRYKYYQELESIPMKDAVTKVNLNLDKPFYSEIITISDPGDITVLVNKFHELDETFVPSDLVSIPSFPSLQIRQVAVDDLEKLLAAAKLDGVMLIPYSTYRSYQYQKSLYEKYLSTDVQANVDTYSARPGHSEHQLGLALDVRSSNHWYNLNEKDYEWMQKNSYKYGFIIRYPKDHSEVTGYKEEPWHIRYVGVEHATKVHELGITYDEYYDLYLTQY